MARRRSMPCHLPLPPGGGGWAREGLRASHRRRGSGTPSRGRARLGPRPYVRLQGLRRSRATCNVGRATSRFLAYVSPPLTALPTVELTVYPYDCDAFGHLNQAALLALLERARWDALARGPGMDLFDRNGVWPAARKAVIEYKAGVYPRDVLRIETLVAHRGTTSMTLRHVVRRVSDGVVAAEAEIVFVCVDRVGRATPFPEAIARSEEHTSELQSQSNLVCRLLLEKKNREEIVS